MLPRWACLLLPAVAMAADLVEMGCQRDQTLPFCANRQRALAAKTKTTETGVVTDKDKQACAELRLEYVKVCALSAQHKTDNGEQEFCQAFENICFRIPNNEPDQQTAPKALIKELEPMENAHKTHSKKDEHTPTSGEHDEEPKRRIDFTRFCKEFKNRYLFVCPDPFRFGQKAVVFCPIYSERCHVPLPDRPVVPTRRPPKRHRTLAMDKLCRSYRSFADNYCSNPLLLSQPQYREGCEKYWRFCTKRRRG